MVSGPPTPDDAGRRSGTPGEPGAPGVPAPLVVAASLTGVEALLLVLQGAAELLALSEERLTMGVTTSLFFVAYGGGLGVCAWALARGRSWSRAPVVVAQLIQVAVAASFWGGATAWVAAGLFVVAALVLVGVFHPASLRALADE